MTKKKLLIDMDFVLRDWLNALENTYIKQIAELNDTNIENLETIWEYFKFPQYVEMERETDDDEVVEKVLAIDEKSEWQVNRDYFNKFVLDNVLEIFGHAKETVPNAISTVNRLQQESPDFEITLLSNSKGKAIPATYFFLSKSGCEITNVKFIKTWDDVPLDYYDHIITANTDALKLHQHVTLVTSKFNQDYDYHPRIDSIKWVGSLSYL